MPLATLLYEQFVLVKQEALAIRRVFSLVDMITNIKFLNCTLVLKIGAAR